MDTKQSGFNRLSPTKHHVLLLVGRVGTRELSRIDGSMFVLDRLDAITRAAAVLDSAKCCAVLPRNRNFYEPQVCRMIDVSSSESLATKMVPTATVTKLKVICQDDIRMLSLISEAIQLVSSSVQTLNICVQSSVIGMFDQWQDISTKISTCQRLTNLSIEFLGENSTTGDDLPTLNELAHLKEVNLYVHEIEPSHLEWMTVQAEFSGTAPADLLTEPGIVIFRLHSEIAVSEEHYQALCLTSASLVSRVINIPHVNLQLKELSNLVGHLGSLTELCLHTTEMRGFTLGKLIKCLFRMVALHSLHLLNISSELSHQNDSIEVANLHALSVTKLVLSINGPNRSHARIYSPLWVQFFPRLTHVYFKGELFPCSVCGLTNVNRVSCQIKYLKPFKDHPNLVYSEPINLANLLN